MNPITTKESNFTYLGPTPNIADLPCRIDGTNTFSIWELTEQERKLVAEGANIRLGIYGAVPIPPVSLQVVHTAGLFEKISAPCRVCGKESSDSIHDGGIGSHVYKI